MIFKPDDVIISSISVVRRTTGVKFQMQIMPSACVTFCSELSKFLLIALQRKRPEQLQSLDTFTELHSMKNPMTFFESSIF